MKTLFMSIGLIGIVFGLYAGYQLFIKEPEILPYSASSAFDTSDPVLLSDWSDYVFVGKVIRKIGEKTNVEGIEKTQFEVEVVKTIKGELGKTAVVSQYAGHRIVGLKRFLVLQEGDKLLQDGEIYLFAGRLEEKNKWIDLVTIDGNQHLKTKEEQEKVIEIMKEAAKQK